MRVDQFQGCIQLFCLSVLSNEVMVVGDPCSQWVLAPLDGVTAAAHF